LNKYFADVVVGVTHSHESAEDAGWLPKQLRAPAEVSDDGMDITDYDYDDRLLVSALITER
jgi:hypothetical protein